MLYVILDDAGEVADVVPCDEVHDTASNRDKYQSRWDWDSLEKVQEIADKLTAIKGKKYLGIDGGAWISPRYDIIEAPAIGDDVSYAFNGDYYPAGTIVKISPTMKRIVTNEGVVFYGDPVKGRWVRKGGTFGMVRGTISRLNPEF